LEDDRMAQRSAVRHNRSKTKGNSLRSPVAGREARRGLRNELCSLVLVLAIGGCPAENDGPPLGDSVSGVQCPGAPKPRAPIKPSMLSAFPTCCDGTARMVPAMLIPPDFAALLRENPDDKNVCVPELYATDPDYTPTKCTSLLGLPGACLSSCVSQIGKAPIPMPQDICQGNELCAPCVDPRTRTPSGACTMGELACDPTMNGAVEPYEPCGVGGADTDWCVPKDLIPEAMRMSFDIKGCKDAPCKGADDLCVPKLIVTQYPKLDLPKCEVSGLATILGAQFKDGRCVSKCMKKVSDNAWALAQSTCGTNEICTPCLDPMNNAVPTGLCVAPSP